MLKGKTALITGSRGGLGREIAKLLAQNGADLILHNRTPSAEFTHLAQDLSTKYGVLVREVFFDLTDTEAMKQAVRDLLSSISHLDVLINNAAIPHGGLFQMTSITKIREVFEINLFAQMQLTQLLMRKMVKQQSGSIINISSIYGTDLTCGECAYGVSKAALNAFTQTLAAELGPLGVRVNAVAPGLVDSGMADKMEEGAVKRLCEGSAMHRLAKPHEIAQTVLYLASDLSSFVNGQTLRVDGGQA